MADQIQQPDQQQVQVPQTQEKSPTPAPASVADDEKFFAALGYFGPLFVVPFIVKPKSAYCKFHALQSLVMFLVSIVVLVVLASIPMIGSLLTLALFALYILALYRAYKGDMWKIPGVSVLAAKVDVNKLYGTAGLAISNISGLKEKAQDAASNASEAVKDLGKQEEEKPAQK